VCPTREGKAAGIPRLLRLYHEDNEVSHPFDARGLASGVYLYRLTAGAFTETKRLVVVK